MTAFAPVATTPRQRFLERVACAFDEAGVEYVFLHDYAATGRDSDVDVGIGRQSLDIVDLLARLGTLGRLLQRIDYDVPWSRYYVFEADEPGRRYRQLDCACDPWGMGRYGRAVSIALAHRRRINGVSLPEPAAEALYLAVKRARKGTGELDRLQEAFAHDPAAATDLFEEEFGFVGKRLAAAIRAGSDLDLALCALARLVTRECRAPRLVALRAAHGARRIVERVAHPTGLVLGLVGPDGVGKSTVADGLERSALGAFRRVKRYHLTPGLLPPPRRLLRRRVDVSDEPHGRAPSSRVGSSLRVAYLGLDTALGWPTRVALPRVESTLVVFERGLIDLAMDPLRYRLQHAPRLELLGKRLLPTPDLVLALDAPATAVRQRRQELPVDEIERQLQAWRAQAELEPTRVRLVDAARAADDVVCASLDAIDDALACRQRQLRFAATALRCMGGPVAGGEPYRLLSARGRPRWLVPPGVDPSRVGLYRPVGTIHHAAARVLGRSSRALGRVVAVDPGSGMAPRIASALGLDRVELAAALPRDDAREHRFVIAVLHGRELVAFGKVSSRSSELCREASVLEALHRCVLKHIAVPRVLDLLELDVASVLLLSPLATRGNVGRPMGRPEHDALVELAELTDELSPVLGREAGLVAVHGDFTGWNSAPLLDGRLALWDWEEARLGLPLEDYFHWKVRRLLLLGAGDAVATVREAACSSPELSGLCRRLAIDPSASALLACLRREEQEPRTARQRSQLDQMARLAATSA